MIGTKTVKDIVWCSNPFPASLGNKWIRIVDCITLLRNGFALGSFPHDVQKAIEDYIEKRRS